MRKRRLSDKTPGRSHGDARGKLLFYQVLYDRVLKSFCLFLSLKLVFWHVGCSFCFFTVVSYTDKRFLDLKPLSFFSFET